MKQCLTLRDLHPIRSVYACVCAYIYIYTDKHNIGIYYQEWVDKIKLLVSNHLVRMESLSNYFLSCIESVCICALSAICRVWASLCIVKNSLEMLLMFK